MRRLERRLEPDGGERIEPAAQVLGDVAGHLVRLGRPGGQLLDQSRCAASAMQYNNLCTEGAMLRFVREGAPDDSAAIASLPSQPGHAGAPY
jgi:hypothetical protein